MAIVNKTRLLSWLNQSDTAKKDDPLYQLIKQLILNQVALESIFNTISGGGSSPITNITEIINNYILAQSDESQNEDTDILIGIPSDLVSSLSKVTDDNATDATMYPLWVNAVTGALSLKVSSTKLMWNPALKSLGIGTVPSVVTAFPLEITANAGGQGFEVIGTGGTLEFKQGGARSTMLVELSTVPFIIGTGAGSTIAGARITLSPKDTAALSVIDGGNVGIGTESPTRILSLKAGDSTTLAQVGGVIADFFADASVGGAETDIYSTTLAASILETNGDKIIAQYGGNFVTVGTELTQLKVYFAGTVIWDSTAVAPPTGTTSWNVDVKIIRVSSSIIRYTISLNTTGMTVGYDYTTVGELTGLTLSNTNILKITGTSSGVGSGAGDIVGKMGYLEWKPAA